MEIQEMVRCTIMRGGTSKGIFFHRNDLPKDPELRDKIIRRVFGAPDRREIDGLGGADPHERGALRIGHPAGIICPEGRVAHENGGYVIKRSTVDRTARCLMRGYAMIPKDTLKT